ncbi:MAG: GTP-binding protein EngB [Candidatus Hadarchaeaceae archaeon]|nr:GTP-binding protein EngB [Hadesarchaea archaeon]MDH5685441.1 GTP-binding protein EngB [Hadesarchaea archaeon]
MEIVLVGRSNVGKSSVIKQLTGKRVRVGKRPGVTRRPYRYRCGELELIDMPGFGFMVGVSRERREEIKTSIVRYLERNRRRILFALEVLDARAFGEIVERWEKRGQVPLDVEMFQFLQELELNPIVAVNKIDLIYPEERDALLDNVCEKLGLPLPWRQWLDVVVPISAKTGEGVKTLKKLLRQRLHEIGREHLLNWLK